MEKISLTKTSATAPCYSPFDYFKRVYSIIHSSLVNARTSIHMHDSSKMLRCFTPSDPVKWLRDAPLTDGLSRLADAILNMLPFSVSTSHRVLGTVTWMPS